MYKVNHSTKWYKIQCLLTKICATHHGPACTKTQTVLSTAIKLQDWVTKEMIVLWYCYNSRESCNRHCWAFFLNQFQLKEYSAKGK